MKLSPRAKILIALAACNIILLFPVARAEEMPKLDDLAFRIISASVPTNHYTVDVTQINGDTPTSLLGSPMASSTSLGLARQTTYRLRYDPDKGFTREPIQREREATAAKGSTSADNYARVSINIPLFLTKVRAWPNNSVSQDSCAGRSCYKVVASCRDASAIFWVDAGNNCVLKVILNIQQSRFSETTLTYRLDKNRIWLLANADMVFAADGSHVRLEYGAYTFSTP